MKTRPMVLLAGDSVLIDGVAHCLRERQTMDVVRVDPAVADIKTCVMAISPDVIIFEMDTPQSQSILDLLPERSGTLLLGIDLTCNRVMVLNSRECVTRSMLDLYRVFLCELQRSVRPSNGGTVYGQDESTGSG